MLRAAALTAALFLAAGVVPFVGVLLMLFAPTPILAYAVGRPGAGPRMALTVGLSLLLVALAAGTTVATGYAVTFGLATAIVCLMLEWEQRFELIVVTATMAMMVAGTVSLLVMAGSPEALAHMIRDTLMQGFARSAEFYKSLGMGDGIDAASRERLADDTVRLIPAIAAMAAALMVTVNLACFWRWLGKRRLSYPLFGDLALWCSPEWMIWLLLATGFALFIPAASIRVLAIDGFICTAAIYFCQGLAIVAYYFRMLAMPVAFRSVALLLVCLMAMQPILALLVSGMGIFDMWVDFRRLKRPPREADSFGNFS
jgi:uncharacterized protein YybS (DUF2232 family)